VNLLSYLRRHRISGTPIVSGFVLFLTAFVVYWWGNTSLFFSHGDARWSQGAGTQELHKLGIDPKQLCEISVERVGNIAPVTVRLVDWFLAEVCSM